METQTIFDAATSGDMVLALAALVEDRTAAWAIGPGGWTALHLAAHYGHRELVELLLDRGADVLAVSANGMANQPIHAAAAGRDANGVILILLARGAEVDATQRGADGGWTALHEAADNGDLALIHTLLAHGANPTLRNDGGQTALDLATAKGHAAAAELLRAAVSTP